MSRNSVYVSNETTTDVQSGELIPIGSIVRRRGGCMELNGNAITILDCGYFDVDVAVTFTSKEAGDAVIELRHNGIIVAGATATESIFSPETETRSVCIPATIRIPFKCNPATITVTVNGIPISVENFAIRIVKQ